MSTCNWKKFLRFLRAAKIHLFLRTINIHLQIIVNDHIEPEPDENDDVDEDDADNNETDTDNETINSKSSLIKSEAISLLDSERLSIKLENAEIKETSSLKKESEVLDIITLKSLNDCIESVNF